MDEDVVFQLDEADDVNEINVTPLVNLSLVLLLIFIVTSPYFSKELMPVHLPEAVSSKSEREENITISISPSEGFAINEVPILKKALGHQLKRQLRMGKKSYVLIRADERVPHGEIEDVMKICKQIGVKRIGFATIPKIR